VFSDRFDVLMSKLIFKNKKNIILKHFRAKKTFKNNCYHTFKHTINLKRLLKKA
jgi:hypothetical protein